MSLKWIYKKRRRKTKINAKIFLTCFLNTLPTRSMRRGIDMNREGMRDIQINENTMILPK